MRQNPDFITNILKLNINVSENAIPFIQQLIKSDNKELSIQILLSFLGMTIFPFIARFPFQNIFNISDDEYKRMLEQRKELIPNWINEIIKTS